MNALSEGVLTTRATETKDERPLPSENPSQRRSRMAVYFTRYGWIHAILLLCVWLFLFPFFWMLATSLKTDEELAANSPLPAFLRFRPASPYVREAVNPVRPTDVDTDRWNAMLPKLNAIALQAIAQYQAGLAALPSIVPVDVDAHRDSAAGVLVGDCVAKIDRRLWNADKQQLLNEFNSLITESSIANALSNSLAQLELATLQLRTLDLHIYNLTVADQFASDWHVESGPGRLLKSAGKTLLSYDFPTPASQPIVLRYDFHLPLGMKPSDLYKLILSIGADNSWHRVGVTLDLGGERWVSEQDSYIAQFRSMSMMFQPPTFDDEEMRAKLWVSLKRSGESRPILSSGDNVPATLRVILKPSSTLQANWGKALRNYMLAVNSVPFWRYFGNSIMLVVLCVAGSLFSASFVAYAFARLHWPGRSVAFLILLGVMMLPAQVTMIPSFMIWRSLHWYNTLNPLWVPAFFGNAFFVFLMTQQMRTIPRELEEAARIDGLNAIQSWYYIMLPNVTPTLTAIALLSFTGAWNDFMGPLIYLRDQTQFPLSMGLYGLGLMRASGDPVYNWSVVMAGNILMTLPVILVFFLFQRYFVQGMTFTGLKG
jgi:multiple sugar transport system permease protein